MQKAQYYQSHMQQFNNCIIESDNDEEEKEKKSNLAMQMIGVLKMY